MSLNDNFHNVNSTYLELHHDLGYSTPKECVTLTHSVPSVEMFFALKTKLQNCTEMWLQEFLYLDGLDCLLNTLQELSGHGFTCFSDAVLLMDCIACIRSILNTSIGLEFFINGDLHTKKLTLALTCSDTLPKKQVLEMLTAMCVYNSIGYLRVMEGLSYVKSECDQVHRFSFVTNDLQKSEAVAHKTAILTFINSIINCTPDVTERNRIRNEFIGLNLLDMLSVIRNEEPDEDLLLQLEVFHERRVSDEECVRADNNIDFNSPQDLQEQIQARVFGSQKMANFVNVLQDLLAIETVYPDNSVKIWQTVDNLIHHIVHTIPARKLDILQSELQRLFFVQSSLCPQHVDSCSEEMSATDLKLKQSSSPCFEGNEIHLGNHAITCSKSCDIGQRKKCTTTGICERVDVKQNQCPENDMDMERNAEERSYVTSSCSDEMSKTVTHFGQCSIAGIANNCNTALVDSYGSDPTLVVNKNECSCDISYFCNNSNVDRGLRSSSNPSDDCVKSSASNSENASPCSSSGQSLSISSKLSKACNNQRSIDNNSCDCKMNINVAESKAKRYNQYKVSSMLDELFAPLYEYSQRAATECDNELNDLCKPELVKTKSSRCRNVKPNNHICRQLLPAPSRRMQLLNWVTLEDERIVDRKPCVWLPPLSVHEKVTVNLQKLENEFHALSPEKWTVVEEVVLLSARTRLNINLFLNRLDSGVEDLVNNIEEDKTDQLSLSMLQYLIKILPCSEEIQMLRHYTGPRLALGMAEQFVLLLSDNAEYSIVLDGYVMRAEFDMTVCQFKTCLTSMIKLANLILKSTEFKQILHYILDAGNFMNYGNFNSNVTGFKLTTLDRLKDIKSVFGNMTLIHHIIQAVCDANKTGLSFIKDILSLEKDAICSIEDMKTDMNKLNIKLRYFMYNLSSASTKVQVKFQQFIEKLRIEFARIQNATMELRNLTDQMAAYFCEDVTKFNLQDCFKCIVTFCMEIKKCQLDMAFVVRQQQQLLEKKGREVFQNRRKNKLTSQAFGQNAAASSSLIKEEVKVLENILDQLHQGIFNPNMKSVTAIPDRDDAHPFEMSCIPFEGSPFLDRHRLGTIVHDHMLLNTPELVCARPCSDECKMRTSPVQKILQIATTCTAQVRKDTLIQPIKVPQMSYPNNIASPINVQPLNTNYSGAFQKKLFFSNNPIRANTFNKDVQTDGQDVELHRQLGLASHKASHHRSRSDITDSILINNKWLEYEKAREAADGLCDKMAPTAEPESICNISTLNLENRGKFISNRDVLALKNMAVAIDVRGLEVGPQIRLPDCKSKRVEKKSAVGGFFSKLGRAVLKPRNVYADDIGRNGRVINEDKEIMKKTVSLDKENADEKLPVTDNKKGKLDGNASKVSRFFQRGGLYRSSKMKKKNQNPVQ